jgi:hypothetical protein
MSTSQEPITLETAVLHEEQWRGEWRVNWVRTAALIALYGQHVFSARVLHDPTITPEFDRAATVICAAWFMAILGIHYALWRRWLPPYLKYGAALWDLTMCGIIMSYGDGPRSSLLILLPVVVAASAVRLSKAFVWFSTVGAWLCYLAILAHYAWFQVGFDKYYSTPDLRIPRTQQIVTLLVIGAAGLLAGQSVRQVQRVISLRRAEA